MHGGNMTKILRERLFYFEL